MRPKRVKRFGIAPVAHRYRPELRFPWMKWRIARTSGRLRDQSAVQRGRWRRASEGRAPQSIRARSARFLATGSTLVLPAAPSRNAVIFPDARLVAGTARSSGLASERTPGHDGLKITDALSMRTHLLWVPGKTYHSLHSVRPGVAFPRITLKCSGPLSWSRGQSTPVEARHFRPASGFEESAETDVGREYRARQASRDYYRSCRS